MTSQLQDDAGTIFLFLIINPVVIQGDPIRMRDDLYVISYDEKLRQLSNQYEYFHEIHVSNKAAVLGELKERFKEYIDISTKNIFWFSREEIRRAEIIEEVDRIAAQYPIEDYYSESQNNKKYELDSVNSNPGNSSYIIFAAVVVGVVLGTIGLMSGSPNSRNLENSTIPVAGKVYRTRCVSDNGVNLRAEPFIKPGNIIVTLPCNTPVIVTGELIFTDDYWYPVRIQEGQKGFIAKVGLIPN